MLRDKGNIALPEAVQFLRRAAAKFLCLSASTPQSKMPERAGALKTTSGSILAPLLIRRLPVSPSLGRLLRVGLGMYELALGVCASTTIPTLGRMAHAITQQYSRLKHRILASKRPNASCVHVNRRTTLGLDLLRALTAGSNQHADLNPLLKR